MIAMALICRPALLIADEPTTALDVTIQAQILELLRDLQHKLNMAMLLITHDLGVVANMADEVVVIYHGEIMEAGPVDAIFRRPQHPYLKGLMAAVPAFRHEARRTLEGPARGPGQFEHIVGQEKADRKRAGDSSFRSRPGESLSAPQIGPVWQQGQDLGQSGGRHQLRYQARRMPRSCRRKRQRQNHGQQNIDARYHTRQRLRHL